MKRGVGGRQRWRQNAVRARSIIFIDNTLQIMLLFTYKFVQKVDFVKSIGAKLAGLLLTGIILFSWAGNVSATEEHPFLPEGATPDYKRSYSRVG